MSQLNQSRCFNHCGGPWPTFTPPPCTSTTTSVITITTSITSEPSSEPSSTCNWVCADYVNECGQWYGGYVTPRVSYQPANAGEKWQTAISNPEEDVLTTAVGLGQRLLALRAPRCYRRQLHHQQQLLPVVPSLVIATPRLVPRPPLHLLALLEIADMSA